MAATEPGWRAAALLSIVLGTVCAVVNVRGQELSSTDRGVPYVRLYEQPSTRFEVLLDLGDGQAFAALAQDPLLRRPDVFRAGPTEAAYRAQRPLLGWAAWGLSAGQANAVPAVLVVLAVAGFVALAAMTAALLRKRGAPALWALAIVLWPGTLMTLSWTGPEGLGTAAALGGFGLWQAERRRWAIVALVAAGLLRESLQLVPVAMAAHALVVERRPLRAVAPLAAPVVVYAAWVGIVWLRLDALPSDAGRGRLAAPLTGLIDAASGWSSADVACAALLGLLGGAALVLGRRDAAGWVAGAFALASLVFGAEVWARLEDFGRVLLPIVAFAALVLAPRVGRRPGAPVPAVGGIG
jgi:hypothetical protein